MTFYRMLVVLLLTLAWQVLPGCGSGRPKTIRVTGTVTYEGKPIEGANVMFMSDKSRPSYAFTDASGRFSLGTFGQTDGAVEGEHTVVISKAVFSGGIFGKPASQEEGAAISLPRGEQKLPQQAIPVQYTSPTQSPLKATVTSEGNNDFQFDLTN